MTAFQPDAFQGDAFQIGAPVQDGAPPAADLLLRTLMGFGQSIVLFLVFTLGV